MCMTCGCGAPELPMGDGHLTIDNLKEIASKNNLSLEELLRNLKEAIEKVEKEIKE